MKVFRNSIKSLVLAGTFLMMFNIQVVGQENFNISAGFGLPELLNVGVRYQLNQNQLGVSIGTHDQVFAVTADIFQHIAGSSDFSDRRPLYIRSGLTYLRDEGDIFIDRFLILGLRVGRDFNLSKKIGVQLDLGSFFKVLHHETKKVSYEYGRGADYNIFIPALGISLFYRL